MNLLWLLVFIGALFIIFGNPRVGPRVYPGYNYGYFPGIFGFVVVIVILFLLFGSGGHSLNIR
jgi:hypothetical protein